MRLVKNLFFITIIFISLFFSIVFYNRIQIEPTKHEILLLKKHFGNINIRSKADVFRVSQQVVNEVVHQETHNFPLLISSILEKRKGYCYDRSFVLQKIFIYNNIPIRPIYIYYSNNGTDVSVFDLFDKNLMSHNVFEYYLDGKWNLMMTNNALYKSITLDEYIQGGKFVPKNSKYIRYLNNRNGRFIYPSCIPDIYFF